MTHFESIATSLNLPICAGKNGQYEGKAAALYSIVTGLIFNGDYSNAEIERLAVERFYEIFPYMRNA